MMRSNCLRRKPLQPLPLLQLVQVRNERRAGIFKKKMTRGIFFLEALKEVFLDVSNK